MTVSIIGSGNVASCLARIFKQNDIQIVQIYARNPSHAKTLAFEVNAELIKNPEALNPNVDLVIFCITDDSYSQFLNHFPVKLKNAVHTAGSLPLNLLQPIADSYGVFYPLNSLSKNQNLKTLKLTLCLEASDSVLYQLLYHLGEQINAELYHITSEQRQSIHLAAVFAQNFTNFMYIIAQNLLQKEKLDFHILEHLIEEHFEKLKQYPVQKIQTGPAIRENYNIINKHLTMLKGHFSEEIYKLISQKITAYYHPEKTQKKSIE